MSDSASEPASDPPSARTSARHVERPPPALRLHGADAVSFQALESGLHWWRDSPPPHGTGATLAYADTGHAWIAVGSPLTSPDRRARATRRFLADARAAGRRGALFGIEDLTPIDAASVDDSHTDHALTDFAQTRQPDAEQARIDQSPIERTPTDRLRRLPLGLQSILLPSHWPDTLRAKPRLREQLRRARAKGVTVRRLDPRELAEGTPTRLRVEEIRRLWLGSRRMEPMQFLVSVEPFHAPDEHIYLAAERHGRIIQFLSAVPIYARRGWLMEDMLRTPEAPNGTTELLIDRLLRDVQAADDQFVTPGLTPLAGAIPWWLRAARLASRPLYDFAGLERFRARLSPPRWDPVWLVWDRGAASRLLLDVLSAFAGGALFRFGWRTLVRHPSAPPWALALPLVPWTVCLALLAATGHADLLGFSTRALAAWVIFDAALAWLLFRAAQLPRPTRLATAAACAGADAALSVRHLLQTGLGGSIAATTLRLTATLAPIAGCAALIWALRRATTARSAG